MTLTVAGRAKVLSCLAGEAARPELTPVGEAVKAALLALHRVNQAVTLSDFVIMPDHLHFIMIIDYGRAGRTSPLYLAHRLMDAIEIYVERAGLGRTGLRPEPRRRSPEPQNVANLEPRSIAYPEPQDAASPEPRGEALRETMVRLMREAIDTETAAWRAGEAVRSCGARPIFDRSCHIDLSFDSRQLKAVRHYIKLNPARAIWKQEHPDRFRRVEVPAERLLGREGRGYAPNPSEPPASNAAGNAAAGNAAVGAAVGGAVPWGSGSAVGGAVPWGSGRSPVLPRVFHALGDITVLGSPFFMHVRLTLKKTVAEHEAAIAEAVAEAQRGRVPVSGFISPGERELLKRLKATPGVRFVKMLPWALPPRYDPSAEDSREIAAGRMVLLSGFPDTPAMSALEMKRDSAAAREFRHNCLAMNDLAAALATSH